MRTVNEVVVDVLANPEAYAHAFPVAGPERVLMAFDPETATITMSGINELANGASLTPEMMEFVRQRMLREAVHNYWTDGNTRFVRDESHPRDRVTMVNVPLREDSVADRLRRGEWSGFSPSWRAIADEAMQHMPNLTAIDDPSRGMADQPAIPYYAGDGQTLPGSRPDHYRVSPSRCRCGFTSMFSSDMAQHLEGPVGHSWWTVCECGASALCRAVARYRPGGHSPAGVGQSRNEQVYLCRACYQRRGIR